MNSLQYIEQYFNGTQDFGRKSSCSIMKNGSAINKICLKIVLQTNGTNEYIDIYQLIKNVSLEVDHVGSLFSYSSEQLQILDKRYNRFDSIKKMYSRSRDGSTLTLYYPIDLNLILGKQYIPGINIIGSRGLVLDDIRTNIRIIVEFGDVRKESAIPISFNEASMYICYLSNEYSQISTDPNNNRKPSENSVPGLPLIQEYNYWIGDTIQLSEKDFCSSESLRLPLTCYETIKNISEMILFIEKDNCIDFNLSSYRLEIDGRDMWDIDSCKVANLDYQIDHQGINAENNLYGCYLDLNNLSELNKLFLYIRYNGTFDKSLVNIHPIKIHCLFKVNSNLIYENGSVKFQDGCLIKFH
jgi:hypothetical protein